MYISFVIMALLTALVFVYVFSLDKTEMNLLARIIVASLEGAGFLFLYSLCIFGIIGYYASAYESSTNHVEVPIGFIWFVFIISLYILKEFLGAVLGRDRTSFLSD